MAQGDKPKYTDLNGEHLIQAKQSQHRLGVHHQVGEEELMKKITSSDAWWQLGGSSGSYAGDCAVAMMDDTLIVVDMGTQTMYNRLKKITENIIEKKLEKEEPINHLILIITHWHTDHIGGNATHPDNFANELSKHMRKLSSNDISIVKITTCYAEKTLKNNKDWEYVKPNTWVQKTAGDILINVYQPEAQEKGGQGEIKNLNDTSLGILIVDEKNGQNKLLTTGDMERTGQAQLGQAIQALLSCSDSFGGVYLLSWHRRNAPVTTVHFHLANP